MKRLAFALMFAAGCASEPAPTDAARNEHRIEPGVGIGAVKLDATHVEVEAALGRASALPSNGLFFAQYRAAGLEVIYTSPNAAKLVDDARVLGVSAIEGSSLTAGARPGLRREEIVAALGAPTEASGRYLWWSNGVGVELASDAPDAIATRVAVFPPYTLAPLAPKMIAARSAP